MHVQVIYERYHKALRDTEKVKGHVHIYIYTVIPRLMKIIRSGITFVSQNLR